MRQRTLALAFALATAALGACKIVNSQFCDNPEHASDPHCSGSGSGGACMNNEDCVGDPGGPACSPAGVCVACNTEQDCAANPAGPVCNAAAHTCGPCTKNTDCPSSGLCLVDTGQCAAVTDVSYVSNNGADADPCTFDKPCKQLAKAVGQGTKYVHVDAFGSGPNAVTIDHSVAIFAEPDARMMAGGNPAIRVMGTNGTPMAVSISELVLDGTGDAGTADGIVATGNMTTLALTHVTVVSFMGVGVTGSGKRLTLSRCTIQANKAGGILVDHSSTFDVTNTFSVRNGADVSLLGGIDVVNADPATSVLAFDTFADNRVKGNSNARAAGSSCPFPAFTATNNIFFRNADSNLADSEVTALGCTYGTSLIRDLTGKADVGFVDPDNSMYKLLSSSMAVDHATDPPAVPVDNGGQARTGTPDLGADELGDP